MINEELRNVYSLLKIILYDVIKINVWVVNSVFIFDLLNKGVNYFKDVFNK